MFEKLYKVLMLSQEKKNTSTSLAKHIPTSNKRRNTNHIFQIQQKNMKAQYIFFIKEQFSCI